MKRMARGEKDTVKTTSKAEIAKQRPLESKDKVRALCWFNAQFCDIDVMQLLVDVVLARGFGDVVLLALSAPQWVNLMDLARDGAALLEVIRLEHLAEAAPAQQ
jgi:hypothetical protein